MNIFNELLVRPILNLLLVFYQGFNFVGIPGPLGWSIIALTLTVRGLLSPLTHAQMKSMKKMADLKPHLDELSKKHGSDKQRLQQEQLNLYKREGVNPAAGCIPALVQIPVFIALYNVFLQALGKTDMAAVVADINQQIYPFLSFLKVTTLNVTFFGVNLTVKPNQWQTVGWGLLLVPVVTGFLQWLQTKIMMPPQSKAIVTKDAKKGGDDFAKVMQTQTGIILPLMIGFFSYSFPLGLALYWNTFSVFAIIQQKQINKK